jgi:hypothetical protein
MTASIMRAVCSRLQVCLVLLVLLAIVPVIGLVLYTASEQRQLAAVNAQETALRLVRLVSSGQEPWIEGAHQLLRVWPTYRMCTKGTHRPAAR